MENSFQIGNDYCLNFYGRDISVKIIAILSENNVVCLLDVDEEYKTIIIDTSYLEDLPLQPAINLSELGM